MEQTQTTQVSTKGENEMMENIRKEAKERNESLKKQASERLRKNAEWNKANKPKKGNVND